jgi:hypothetical protein
VKSGSIGAGAEYRAATVGPNLGPPGWEPAAPGGLQASREIGREGFGTLERGMGSAQSRHRRQVGQHGWADRAVQPCGVRQHAQVMEPIGAVNGSASRCSVPARDATGKPSRIQYSIPPIISLTR